MLRDFTPKRKLQEDYNILMFKIYSVYFYRLLFSVLSVGLAIGPHNPLTLFQLKTDTPENNLFTIIICLIIVVYSIFNKSLIRSINSFKLDFLLLISILICFFISSYFYAIFNTTDYSVNIKFFMAIILYVLFGYVFQKDEGTLYISLLVYSVTMSMISFFVFFDLFPGDAVIKSDLGRLNLFGENPNSYSIRCVLAVFSLLYLIMENPIRLSKKRFFLFLFVPFLLYLIIVSGSRGSFIITLAGIIIIPVSIPFNYKLKFLLISIFILVLLVLFSYILSNEYLSNRLINSLLAGDTAGRTTIWTQAMSIYYNSPFLGVGEDGYHYEMVLRYGEHRDTHNLFIYMLVCGGIIPLLIYVYFMFLCFKRSLSKIKSTIYPFLLLLSLFLLMMKTGGVLTFLVMWYFMAVSLSLSTNKIY